MNDGFIFLHRKVRNHWIWEDPQKFQWWVDILMEVNHTPQKVNIGYQLFECNRGQSIKSLSTWAKRWSVSKDVARHFLRLLEKDGMIVHESLGKTTRITICNYDSYQGSSHDSSPIAHRHLTDNSPVAHPNNKDNNEKKENNIFIDKNLTYSQACQKYSKNVFLKNTTVEERKQMFWQEVENLQGDDDRVNRFYKHFTEENSNCHRIRIDNEDYWETKTRFENFK